jgi:hypothetical protein
MIAMPRKPLPRWAHDLLWADPDPRVTRFAANAPRRTSVVFGPEAAREFLRDNGLDLIVRSHQEVEGLVTVYQGVLTLFSCPGYCGRGNRGAVMVFTDMLMPLVYEFEPHVLQPRVRRTGDAGRWGGGGRSSGGSVSERPTRGPHSPLGAGGRADGPGRSVLAVGMGFGSGRAGVRDGVGRRMGAGDVAPVSGRMRGAVAAVVSAPPPGGSGRSGQGGVRKDEGVDSRPERGFLGRNPCEAPGGRPPYSGLPQPAEWGPGCEAPLPPGEPPGQPEGTPVPPRGGSAGSWRAAFAPGGGASASWRAAFATGGGAGVDTAVTV